MSASLASRGALPLLFGVLLHLFPPGHSDLKAAKDTSHVREPAALAHGSRASYPGWNGADSYPLRAVVGPAPARLGQQLVYRGWVLLPNGDRATFGRPDTGGAFTWGEPRAETHKRVAMPDAQGWGTSAAAYPESVSVEVPLQVFATGIVNIPGPRVVIRPSAGRSIEARLPTVHLLVMPTLTAADSSATLRPVHGPLGAPWWERVPWRSVFVVMGVLAAVALLVWWLRRRRRKPAVAPVAAPAAPRVVVNPGAEALAALAKLRALRLPEQGLFGEHALSLTRILRRYLEARLVVPRPGDTSTELLQRLRATRLEPADLQRLEGLLGLWDRVKFARAPLDVPEAQRCEVAVEALIRHAESPPREVA